jgi:hypothetical protein
LYSASFLARYASISFLASSRASLTLLVRSAWCQCSVPNRSAGGSVGAAYTLGLVDVSVPAFVLVAGSRRTFLNYLCCLPLGLEWCAGSVIIPIRDEHSETGRGTGSYIEQGLDSC